jgi:hypothetical protein
MEPILLLLFNLPIIHPKKNVCSAYSYHHKERYHSFANLASSKFGICLRDD